MPRTWVATTMIAVTAAAGVGVAVPSSAAEPTGGPCDKPYKVGTVTPRVLTEHLAVTGPYGPVRAAAMSAVNSPRGDIAINEFIPAGWCAAIEMANDDAAMNDHIIKRVLATHSQASSPKVWAAATEAARSSDPAVKDAFVRHGLEQARAADQRARDEDGTYAATLRQFDRDYVVKLSTTAQGEQVRIAAAWAVRPGSTDSDIVEFYTYAWARFAKLDLEQFRLTTVEQEVRRVHARDRLKQTAEKAAKAAKDASGEAQKALKAQAADAWAAVAADAAPHVSTWQQAYDAAESQYKFWQGVYAQALRQPGPSWKAVIAPARANRQGWKDETDFASKEMVDWKDVVDDALRHEEELRPDEF